MEYYNIMSDVNFKIFKYDLLSCITFLLGSSPRAEYIRYKKLEHQRGEIIKPLLIYGFRPYSLTPALCNSEETCRPCQ